MGFVMIVKKGFSTLYETDDTVGTKVKCCGLTIDSLKAIITNKRPKNVPILRKYEIVGNIVYKTYLSMPSIVPEDIPEIKNK